jgi:hypothetical protein
MRSASARVPNVTVLMTSAVRISRSYGSSSAEEWANSPETASGWAACIKSARGPASASARSRYTCRIIEASVKYSPMR